MVDYDKIIPMRLKYLRERYSYTQNYIANQIGVSQPTYANWEAGRRAPGIKEIAQLADIYETSVDLLLGRTDVENHTS